MRGRLYPGICVSRSFGDYFAHRVGVISEPVVDCVKIDRKNEYLVIATSSLWNVFTPKEVFEYIKVNENYKGEICKKLCKIARERYSYENCSVPDITVII